MPGERGEDGSLMRGEEVYTGVGGPMPPPPEGAAVVLYAVEDEEGGLIVTTYTDLEWGEVVRVLRSQAAQLESRHGVGG